MNSPFRCKDCTERYPGCHDRCEQYQAAKALNDKRRHDAYVKNQASMYQYKHIGNVRNDQAKRRKGQAGYYRFSKGTG